METALIKLLDQSYEDFLHDESRRVGQALSISFPESEDEVIEVVKSIGNSGGTITVQGARTGIVAGAVPEGGHVMNLGRMKSIRFSDDQSALIAGPGAILDEIQAEADKAGAFFPPDPTETTASIGGMVASNASGALSFCYGATRRWIKSIRMVLADGDTLAISRGENFAIGRRFSLITESGRRIDGLLPSYHIPEVKSAAGYYVADNMDLIDLFIGMEGTLGIVTEMELELLTKPEQVCALTMFMPDQDSALKLVRILRGEIPDLQINKKPVAIEFFNCDALELLRSARENYSAFAKIPALKPHYNTAINIEFHGEIAEDLEEAAMAAMEAAIELGGSDEDTWYATTAHELEGQKAFRHAVPEAVNLLIDERRRVNGDIIKLGTDMSVPDRYLEDVMNMYNSDLAEAELESVIFGHVGNNHVHVNILPHSPPDYETGKLLYMHWAQEVVNMGGSVSAEHGIGKIKTAFLEMMFGRQSISEMKSLKSLFDPNFMLNRGNLFSLD